MQDFAMHFLFFLFKYVFHLLGIYTILCTYIVFILLSNSFFSNILCFGAYFSAIVKIFLFDTYAAFGECH